MREGRGYKISVVRYDNSMEQAWNGFLESVKNATFLLGRTYINEVMEHNPCVEDHSLMFYKGDRLVALLPANIEGKVLDSHGRLTYGGLMIGLSTGVEEVMDIFSALRDYLVENSEVEKIIYRPLPHIYASYPAEEDLYALFRYNARLVQRKVSSAVWLREPCGFSTLRRRKVKLAVKSGVTVRRDEDYASFWNILEENLEKRHGVSPVHTAGQMGRLATLFLGKIVLYSAFNSGGDRVAGVVMYVTSRVAHVQYIASTAEGRECGALDCLFSHLINKEYADKEYFEFGNSVEQGGRFLNKGLIFQKEGFGARAVVYDTYEIDVNSIIDG